MYTDIFWMVGLEDWWMTFNGGGGNPQQEGAIFLVGESNCTM